MPAEEALEAPLEILERALAALRILAVGASGVPARLRVECRAAALALWAGAEAAGLVVDANLADGAGGDHHRATLATLRAQAGQLRDEAPDTDFVNEAR